MTNIKFSQLLTKYLKKKGISKKWLSDTLPIRYDTLMFKFREDKFNELEQNYIKCILKMEEK